MNYIALLLCLALLGINHGVSCNKVGVREAAPGSAKPIVVILDFVVE